MLFFNLQVLEAETKDDPEYFLIALYYWFTKQTIPKTAYQKYKPLKKSLKGINFIVNPQDFFKDKLTDTVYKVQYLKLAARRDYFLYKNYGINYLDLSFFPDLNISAIKYNPLLKIKEHKLYFKYEDKSGTLI